MSDRNERMRTRRGWRLLRSLLPAWYRDRYGASLLDTHLERAGGENARTGVRFWAYLAWDVALTSLQARWTGRLGTGARGSGGGDFRDGLRVARVATRTLLKRPGYAATAVVTLALGLGVITAVATVLHTVVLAPTPYDDPDRIVQIVRVDEGRHVEMLPPADARTLRDATEEVLTVGAGGFRDVAVSGTGSPERLRGVVVTGPTLRMLGVSPVLGRLPGESDDVAGGPCRVVLSHEVWQEHYGGSPEVLEGAVRLDGEPCDVAAVMPAGFAFPAPYFAPGDLWLLAGPEGVDWSAETTEGGRWFMVFGRLNPGVDLATLRAGLDVLSARDGGEARFAATRWAASSRDSSGRRLFLLLAAAGLVLLIAWVNVSALQSARSVDRREEIATRMALGASRGQLVRLLAAEAIVLATCGGAAGLALAYWGVQLIVALRSFFIPRMEEAAIGAFSVAVCFGLAGAAALLMTAVPALGLRTKAVSHALRSRRGLTPGRGGPRLGGLVVAVETALALVLVVGATQLLRSYQELTDLDPGFDPTAVLHARLTPPDSRYPDAPARLSMYREVEERIRALPDVRDAALTWVPPGVGAGADRPFAVAGREPAPATWPRTVWRPVSEGYFRVLRIPLVRGEGFERHRGTPRPAIVNETFARRFFPGKEALGERLHLVESVGADQPEADAWTIVGVVADVREEYVHTAAPPAVYVRYEDAPPSTMAILARTLGDPLAAAPAIREAVAAVDPDQPIYGLRDLAFILESELDLNRLGLTLLAIFAAAAVLLAVAGIYGVVSHAVGRRLREMGIRIALGAAGAQVSWLVVRSSGTYALAGAVVGLGGAIVLGDLLRALTPGWVGLTPWVLASAAAGVTAVALAAAWVPARRAASADPVEALRRE